MRTLFKMVKKLRRSSPWLPRTLSLSPSSSSRKAFWSRIWSTSVRAAYLYEGTMNHFSQHFMGLSEFLDTLSPIILHFNSDIWVGSLCVEISLIRNRRRLFPLLCIFTCLICLHSCQDLVMVDLLNNFLNPLSFFKAVVSDFMKLLWWRHEGGEKRMIHARPATANQVRDREKELKQKFFKRREL